MPVSVRYSVCASRHRDLDLDVVRCSVVAVNSSTGRSSVGTLKQALLDKGKRLISDNEQMVQNLYVYVGENGF